MKRIFTFLISLLFVSTIFATDYPPSSYTLSADGTTLEKWKGDETTIDLTIDSKLSKITIIGSAFAYNKKVTSVTIPETVTTIKRDAFYGTTNLNSIHIPASVTTIEEQAIITVKEITVDANNPSYSSEKGILYNKDQTIAIACGTKKSGKIEFPATLKQTNRNSFKRCDEITELVFPEGMEKILVVSFVDCSSLTKINIPSTVKSLGYRAFGGCRKLSEINCRVANPATITMAGKVFDNAPFTTCKLIVPTQAAIRLYKKADQWSRFVNIVDKNNNSAPDEPEPNPDPIPETIQAALDTIPNDWTNDLRLNSYFRRMKINDTYQIIARRVPEIIDGPISNNVSHPKYHYSVVKGNSVEVNSNGQVKATALGTSIIKVRYDKLQANGYTYGATSPVNVTYMAIDVVANPSDNTVGLKTDIAVLHYDTHYFFGKGVDYSFNVTTNSAENVTVKCNDKNAVKKGNRYTVRLENRANIIEIMATKGEKTEKLFYVIDARKVALKIVNITNKNRKLPVVGDKIQISFKGITLPVYKLATIYNPQMENPSWKSEAAKVVYSNNVLGELKTNVDVSQYNLATQNTMEFTASKSGEYIFTGGKINESWWGDPLGSDIDKTSPGQPNLNAATESGEFSALPAFRVFVMEQLPANNSVVLDLSNPSTPQSFAYNDKDAWTETYNATAYPYIVAQDFSFSHLPSKNNWGGSSWDGFTVSKSTDNAVNHKDFPARQWGCMAQGGVDGKATPYLLGYYSGYMESSSSTYSNAVIFKDNKNYNPQGTYVCNTAYTTKCIEDGFFVARPFVKDDTYTLTAHGLNDQNQPTGKTAQFYLADYRAEKPQDRLLNNRWEWFDLTPLGECAGIYFTVKSTDAGEYGDNTASYFAIDKLVAVPSIGSGINSPGTSVLSVIPNPTNDYVTINISGAVTIFNTNGVKIYENANYVSGAQISLSHVNSGIYFVRINNNTHKLIKQ